MKIQTDRNSRDFSLTFIQVVCALAVVTLHTNGCFWSFSATERYWFTANIIECACYFAVPVFFMITGITLLDYQDKYSTREYFKKRAEKTLLPYLAWSMVGIVFLLASKRVTPEIVTAKWIFNGLLSTDGIIDIYWFFQPLFCIYLCIPLYAAVEKGKKMETAKYLLWMGLIVNIFFPFLNSALNLGLQWPYRISVISNYLFWTWGGTTYITILRINGKKRLYMFLQLLVCCFILWERIRFLFQRVQFSHYIKDITMSRAFSILWVFSYY